MAETWRKELRDWAWAYARATAQEEGILGVMIGGSLARRKEWRHSDMELGILVETRQPGIPYFNVDNGRGVEKIQLVRSDLEEQVRQAEAGDVSAILNWPIQLWTGVIIADPSGLLERFKQQFDPGLFSEVVLQKKRADQHVKIEKLTGETAAYLDAGKPAAALTRLRLAVNEAILALHWHFSDLPRSQNRTDSRLRQLCLRYSAMPFYEMYREVFRLSETARVIRSIWPEVKPEVLEITRLWGDSARDFFVYAVDSNFAWRQRAGILTVYRLYVPIIGSEGQRLLEKLDDPDWANANRNLCAFLGLQEVTGSAVQALLNGVRQTCQLYEL